MTAAMKLAEAQFNAEALIGALHPFCERIEIAGSIRRRKPEVKDIEIVCIPKFSLGHRKGQADIFSGVPTISEPVNELDALIAAWLRDGRLLPRLGKDGKQAIGPAFKRLVVPGAMHSRAFDVALDLFSVLPPHCSRCGVPALPDRLSSPLVSPCCKASIRAAQWGLILMIRTGSGVGPDGRPETGFGPAMLARWKQVSGGGKSIGGCLHLPDGTPAETPEEVDVFKACRVAWVPPEERLDARAVTRYALVPA